MYFHVSSTRNRASIDAHGLDWRLMGAAPGIAGSTRPEVEGCFVCLDMFELRWFTDTINNTGGPVDVWEILGISAEDLVQAGSGHLYYPASIPRTQLRLRD